MSDRPPLYYRALLAWQYELEEQRRKALEDKETPLSDGLRRKLIGMFGPEHVVSVEVRHDDPYDLVRGAEVEGLRFLGFRSPDGIINVVLVMPCPHCGYQMPSAPLNQLADLGRELLQFDRYGKLNNHECSGPENE
jgi:hypothetical protein